MQDALLVRRPDCRPQFNLLSNLNIYDAPLFCTVFSPNSTSTTYGRSRKSWEGYRVEELGEKPGWESREGVQGEVQGGSQGGGGEPTGHRENPRPGKGESREEYRVEELGERPGKGVQREVQGGSPLRKSGRGSSGRNTGRKSRVGVQGGRPGWESREEDQGGSPGRKTRVGVQGGIRGKSPERNTGWMTREKPSWRHCTITGGDLQ